MNVCFSTVVRKAPLHRGGELVRVDWDRKAVIDTAALSPPEPYFTDPNPRGNGRGGRGILQIGPELIVATYHTLFRFDRNLQPKGTISNNLCIGLHELCTDGDHIWAASTAIDAAIKMDLDGTIRDQWWSREAEALQERFGLVPLDIDKEADNRTLWLGEKSQKGECHTHLNAVRVHRNELFVLLNRFGVVYNVHRGTVVLEEEGIRGCHNLLFVDGNLLINDSQGKRVVIYSEDGRYLEAIHLLDYPEIRGIHREAVRTASAAQKPLFVRGLSAIDERRILVGFSPATIAEFDIRTKELLGCFQYSDDVAVCIHGLTKWV